MTRALAVAVLNDWNLPPEHILELNGYFLRHWQFDYLLKTATQEDGLIACENSVYVPIYIAPLPANPQAQVMLSFRQPKWHTDLPYIVLIKAA